MRPISTIAADIHADWKNIHFAAEPYVGAMSTIHTINDTYGADDARTVVMYFLANAGGWRGPKAKEIKAELKQMLGQ